MRVKKKESFIPVRIIKQATGNRFPVNYLQTKNTKSNKNRENYPILVYEKYMQSFFETLNSCNTP